MSKSVLHGIVENAPDLAPSTRNKYLRDLNAWLVFAGDNPHNWTRATAQRFYQSMLDRGVAPRSANRVMWAVNYASKWWAHQESRPELDFGVVRRAKDREAPKKHQTLTPDTAHKLLMACVGPTPLDVRDFTICVVELETGMRRMSLASMTWSDTRLDQTPATSVLSKGHGDERMLVPLSDTAATALRFWRDRHAGLSGSKSTKNGPVFCGITKRISKTGKFTWTLSKQPLSATAIQKRVAVRGVAAGIGHIHPHLFRHTFVTWRMEAGLQPYEVASITGHKVAGIGALGGYIDMATVGARVRSTTPPWLAELVAQVTQGGHP